MRCTIVAAYPIRGDRASFFIPSARSRLRVRHTIVSRPYVTTKAKMPDDVAKLHFFFLPFRLSLLDAAYLHLDCPSGPTTSAFDELIYNGAHVCLKSPEHAHVSPGLNAGINLAMCATSFCQDFFPLGERIAKAKL